MLSGDDARETYDLSPYRSILDAFEAAWTSRPAGSEAPRVEDYLAEVSPDDRKFIASALQSLAVRLRDAEEKEAASGTRAGAEATASTANDAGAADETDTSIGGDSKGDARQQLEDTGVGDGPTMAANGTDFDVTLEPSGSQVQTTASYAGEIEDCEILGELGRGGMGVVYRAREKTTGRIVCIKMMLSGEFASADALRRFQIETEAAANLDHPNIVPIYRAGMVNGIPFFVMKYVEGTAMDSLNRNELQNDPRRVVELMIKICRAIAFAHSRGILHRDLKPANILLDENDEPHITDFGLAKRINEDSGQTRTGLVMGTPDYMSPEQAIGDHAKVSVTSDVYSLGSILFDLLAGQPPFKSATIVETLSRVTKEPARTPTTFNNRVGKDLETICLKCLEKDPANRYRSAASLADELQRYLRGEPIEGRPVSAAEKFFRWCSRNRSLAALGAAVILLVVTVAIGSTVAAYQINKRRNEAVTAKNDALFAEKLAAAHAKSAEANARIADQQRKLALDTLHSLVTKVDAQLRDRADLADLQSDILQDAFDGLQEVSRTAENSGLADRTVGVAHQRMADILERLGKTSESAQEHKRAIAIFESLIDDDGTDDWSRWNVAISYDKLADRLIATDPQAAMKYYRMSLSQRELLAGVSNDPDLPDSKRQLSLLISTAKLGSLELQQGHPAKARDYFEKALAQSEAMLAENRDSQRLKQAVAGSCALLGRVNFSLGDLPDARKCFNRSLELRLDLHASDATSVSATLNLAGSYDALGDVELQTGETRKAQDYYTSSLRLLQQLYDQDSANADVKGNLATQQYKLATTLERLERPDDARQLFAECLKLRTELYDTDQEATEHQISVMLAQARCGLHRQAAELAGELCEKAADNPGSLFYAACGYALSAEAAERDESLDSQSQEERVRSYTDSAIKTLQRAVELGYHDAAALRTDPDLDPVRGNTQFQEIVGQVE